MESFQSLHYNERRPRVGRNEADYVLTLSGDVSTVAS